MASFTGVVGRLDIVRALVPAPNLLPVVFNKAPQTNYGQEDVIFVTRPFLLSGGYVDAFTPPGPAINVQGNAQIREQLSQTADWFERFHVIPRSFNFGSILSTQQTAFEVYSAFRYSNHSWNDFVNNAGTGVTVLGMPVLPHLFLPQTGVHMTLLVDTIGDPFVDSTLDFVFDSGTTYVPITVQRVTLFNLPPELPYAEILEFLTDVLGNGDGTEQRISIRKNPRQSFEWNIVMEPGVERQRIDSVLFDWQSRIFGIPMWHEMSTLTTSASIGAFVVNVETTNYSDYRIGGLVLIRDDQTNYDVLVLQSMTPTSLTFVNATLKAHGVGAQVMPLRSAVIESQPSGQRYPSDAQSLNVRFRVKDNDVSIASTAAFSTYNGKVLLDDLNGIDNTLAESFQDALTVIDSDSGETEEFSDWDRNKRVSAKTFLAKGRQRVWETRQLVHALHGRQISFYLPTFGRDMELFATTVSGSNQLQINNIGYTQYVQSRQPKNVIRVKLLDGTSIVRKVLSSVIVDDNQETLTLDANWPSAITAAQIDRINYVEKLRFDSDQIRLLHTVGDRVVKISAPVKVVFE